jgi:hypothetical protein
VCETVLTNQMTPCPSASAAPVSPDGSMSLLWVYTGNPRFEQLTPGGKLPPKLGYHTFTALGNRVFSFGGKNRAGRLKDQLLLVYDVAANAWLDVNAKGLGPMSRSGHTATVVGGSTILIYGGRSGTLRLADFSLLQVRGCVRKASGTGHSEVW